MGIETDFGFKRIEFSYQNIYDNVTLLNDEMVKEINSRYWNLGMGRCLKKRNDSIALKN